MTHNKSQKETIKEKWGRKNDKRRTKQ